MLSSLIFTSVASTTQNRESINEFIFCHRILGIVLLLYNEQNVIKVKCYDGQ